MITSMIQLNERLEFIHIVHYFLPQIRIDCSSLDLRCHEHNTIRILLYNPRTNIDIVYAVYEFYFEAWPPEASGRGQVTFPIQCIYSIHSVSPLFHRLRSCDLHGVRSHTSWMDSLPIEGIMNLTEDRIEDILLPVPTWPTRINREIILRNRPSHRGDCLLCTDADRVLYNAHAEIEGVDTLETMESHPTSLPHAFCMPCLIQIRASKTHRSAAPIRIRQEAVPCPLCRQDMFESQMADVDRVYSIDRIDEDDDSLDSTVIEQIVGIFPRT